MSAATFWTVFPFHILVNESGCIVQAGHVLQRLFGAALAPGADLTRAFRITCTCCDARKHLPQCPQLPPIEPSPFDGNAGKLAEMHGHRSALESPTAHWELGTQPSARASLASPLATLNHSVARGSLLASPQVAHAQPSGFMSTGFGSSAATHARHGTGSVDGVGAAREEAQRRGAPAPLLVPVPPLVPAGCSGKLGGAAAAEGCCWADVVSELRGGGGAACVLQARSTGLVLTGRLTRSHMSDGRPVLLFLGSPRVAHLGELRSHGLFLSDIPAHDISRDVVLLAEQRQAESELRERFERMAMELQAANARLQQATRWLDEERIRSEGLLYRMLPADIADDLREGRRVEAIHYPEVTVLFCDVVGYMVASSMASNEQMYDMLNELYDRFDMLADQYPDVYKLETISDAYLLVCNLTTPCERHVDTAIEFGLRMLAEARHVKDTRGEPVRIRIGVHTGPVVGGVLGAKTPRFSVYGDTVNVASRMESHGLPGKVHISAASFGRLVERERFAVAERGCIAVKGRGVMRTYIVERTNDGLSVQRSSPGSAQRQAAEQQAAYALALSQRSAAYTQHPPLLLLPPPPLQPPPHASPTSQPSPTPHASPPQSSLPISPFASHDPALQCYGHQTMLPYRQGQGRLLQHMPSLPATVSESASGGGGDSLSTGGRGDDGGAGGKPGIQGGGTSQGGGSSQGGAGGGGGEVHVGEARQGHPGTRISPMRVLRELGAMFSSRRVSPGHAPATQPPAAPGQGAPAAVAAAGPAAAAVEVQGLAVAGGEARAGREESFFHQLASVPSRSLPSTNNPTLLDSWYRIAHGSCGGGPGGGSNGGGSNLRNSCAGDDAAAGGGGGGDRSHHGCGDGADRSHHGDGEREDGAHMSSSADCLIAAAMGFRQFYSAGAPPTVPVTTSAGESLAPAAAAAAAAAAGGPLSHSPGCSVGESPFAMRCLQRPVPMVFARGNSRGARNACGGGGGGSIGSIGDRVFNSVGCGSGRSDRSGFSTSCPDYPHAAATRARSGQHAAVDAVGSCGRHAERSLEVCLESAGSAGIGSGKASSTGISEASAAQAGVGYCVPEFLRTQVCELNGRQEYCEVGSDRAYSVISSASRHSSDRNVVSYSAPQWCVNAPVYARTGTISRGGSGGGISGYFGGAPGGSDTGGSGVGSGGSVGGGGGGSVVGSAPDSTAEITAAAAPQLASIHAGASTRTLRTALLKRATMAGFEAGARSAAVGVGGGDTGRPAALSLDLIRAAGPAAAGAAAVARRRNVSCGHWYDGDATGGSADTAAGSSGELLISPVGAESPHGVQGWSWGWRPASARRSSASAVLPPNWGVDLARSNTQGALPPPQPSLVLPSAFSPEALGEWRSRPVPPPNIVLARSATALPASRQGSQPLASPPPPPLPPSQSTPPTLPQPPVAPPDCPVRTSRSVPSWDRPGD